METKELNSKVRNVIQMKTNKWKISERVHKALFLFLPEIINSCRLLSPINTITSKTENNKTTPKQNKQQQQNCVYV